MENTTKKVSKKNLVIGAFIGFAIGIIWELMIITPIMYNWTIRSIIVALVVSGCGCSVAGMIFAWGRNKQKEKKESKNEVVA